MKYQMDLQGMHCKGCANLIKMSLEDNGAQEVNVDLPANKANFQVGETDAAKVNALVAKTFADLPGYTYSNLIAKDK